MMEIHECVVCGASIWPVALGHLCFLHRRAHAALGNSPRMVEALRQVAFGERTDFDRSNRTHMWHQLAELVTTPREHWTVQLDDILRAYGVHQERPQDGPAGNESEAA